MYRFRGGWLTKDLYGAVPTVINTGGGIVWLFRDNFDTARAAGAINGTPSEPSGHTRTVTDSVPNAVITGGQYKVTAVAAIRDPWLRYTTGWARVVGRMLRFDASADNYVDHIRIGFSNVLAAPVSSNILGVGLNHVYFVPPPSSSRFYTGNTSLNSFGVILRSTGHYVIVNGKLAFIYRADNIATLYPMVFFSSADASLDLRLDNLGIADLPLNVPTLYPTPTLSDTFSVPQIVDYGDGGLNGTPVNVGLNGSEGKYNGTSSYTNIYSAGLDTLFSGVQGTVITRAKVSDVGVWSDAAYRNTIKITADSNNYLAIRKNNAANKFEYLYNAGGTLEIVQKTAISTTNFMTAGQTWDVNAGANGEFKAYFDGAQEGATQTTLGTWVGALVNTGCMVGAQAINTSVWNGSIADTIISNVVASPAQMATIHTDLAAGTLTKATLDSIFGAGNYVWYKHNEQYLANGLAHVETNTVTALDAGGNALNGTHKNVKLSGSYGTYEAGLLPYTDIYSAAFNTAFNGKEGFVLARARVTNHQVWSDGVAHGLVNIRVNSNNFIYLSKTTGGELNFAYVANATNVNRLKVFTTLNWITVGGTFSDSANIFRVFFDGVQEGADQAPDTWAGAIASTNCVIGAANNTPTFPWSGDISDVVIGLNGVVATPTQMADLHTYLTAGTLTSAILDGMFGANNWAWYRMDEAVTYPASVAWNGSGHFHNAGGKAYISPTPGAELLTNGDFSAWTGDNPDGWTVDEAPPNAQITQNPAGQLQIISDGTSAYVLQNVCSAGKFYRGSIEVTAVSDPTVVMLMGAGESYSLQLTSVGVKTYVGRATSTIVQIKRLGGTQPIDMTVDNASVKELTLPQCLRAVAPASAGEPYQSVKMTITDKTQLGGVINLDSYSNPQYGIHWWVDRVDNKLYARKLVAGVWQADSIAGVAVTYSAGAYGEIRRIGDEIYVFYNGAFVATFTAADVPTTNTLQALFATDSGSYFESDTSYPTGGYDYTLYA